MAIIETDRSVIEFRSSGVIGIAFDRLLRAVSNAIAARRERRQQRLDRKAFMYLVGKEDWVYRDMGIHSGDVDWASRLPLHINAAKELEKIRKANRRQA